MMQKKTKNKHPQNYLKLCNIETATTPCKSTTIRRLTPVMQGDYKEIQNYYRRGNATFKATT